MTRWTSDKEVELLQRYAKLSKFGIVEIGVMDGETTAKLAEASTVPIYGIDPLIPDSMPPYTLGNEELIIKNMTPYKNRFFFAKEYSYNVVNQFSYGFDMLFIDGSHLYEDVKRDYNDWFPKLEVGGYVMFHDSAPMEDGRFGGWAGPTKVTDQLIKEKYNFVERVDTIRVFRK